MSEKNRRDPRDVHGDRQSRGWWDTKPTGGHNERQDLESDEGLLDVEANREAVDAGYYQEA